MLYYSLCCNGSNVSSLSCDRFDAVIDRIIGFVHVSFLHWNTSRLEWPLITTKDLLTQTQTRSLLLHLRTKQMRFFSHVLQIHLVQGISRLWFLIGCAQSNTIYVWLIQTAGSNPLRKYTKKRWIYNAWLAHGAVCQLNLNWVRNAGLASVDLRQINRYNVCTDEWLTALTRRVTSSLTRKYFTLFSSPLTILQMILNDFLMVEYEFILTIWRKKSWDWPRLFRSSFPSIEIKWLLMKNSSQEYSLNIYIFLKVT